MTLLILSVDQANIGVDRLHGQQVFAWNVHLNLFITLLLGPSNFCVCYPNHAISRVNCKVVHLQENQSFMTIWNHVIVNCVIKRFWCI